jgi:hypothetical protein
MTISIRIRSSLCSAKRVAFVIAVAVVVSACGRAAVRASEKEFLANQIMIFDQDGHEAAAEEHVLGNREGAAGGHGAGAGGCGCN